MSNLYDCVESFCRNFKDIFHDADECYMQTSFMTFALFVCDLKKNNKKRKLVLFYVSVFFLFIRRTTHKSMHQRIVKSSVRSKTTHNFRHTDTSTPEHAIVNTIVSTEPTNNAL